MQKLYLIRHAEVDHTPRRYTGITDVPLTARGISDSQEFARTFSKAKDALIFASPLIRARQTAEAFSDNKNRMTVLEGLKEIHLGVLENQVVSEYRLQHPAEYERRGEDLVHYVPENGESFEMAEERFARAVDCVKMQMANEDRDAVVVSHAGVMRAFLCRSYGIPMKNLMELKIPYLGVTEMSMNELMAVSLYHKYETPPQVIRHMRKVAELTEEILAEIDPDGIKYHKERLVRAALVHDLLRTREHHAKATAEVLAAEGMADIAPMVRAHHKADMHDGEDITEEDILFYADKRVQEDRIVSLEERFRISLAKCRTEEAVRHHDACLLKSGIIEERLRKAGWKSEVMI